MFQMVIFFLAFWVGCAIPSVAQSDLEFWRNAKGYLACQSDLAFRQSESVLDAFPPTSPDAASRRLALLQLDVLLHDAALDTASCLRDYVARRAHRVASCLSRPVSGDSVRVCKVYNHGFVVKDRYATIAFDLYSGFCGGQRLIPQELMDEIVSQCDILFISHGHADHADPSVVKRFLAEGKTVVAPDGVLPDLHGLVRVREEDGPCRRSFAVGKRKLTVDILPGHQDDVSNNVYLVTCPGGKSVMHTGDQYSESDLSRLPSLASTLVRPDVLLVNCWALRVRSFVSSLRPKAVVTGHENEMGHGIDHREAFWMSLSKLDGLSCPLRVMSWGEWADF